MQISWKIWNLSLHLDSKFESKHMEANVFQFLGVLFNVSLLTKTSSNQLHCQSGNPDTDNNIIIFLSLDSGHLDSERAGKFLLYWMTTTSTSTSTTYSSTSTLASLECTPNGFAISACG